MTGNDKAEGARAYRAGKRRVWVSTLAQLGGLAAIFCAIVLMRDGTGPGALPQTGAIAAALAIVLLINLGSWWAFRVVDELEKQISLIAFTVGFYAHMTLYAVWVFLWGGGLMKEPDATALFLAAGIASLLACIVLKARR